VIEFHNHHLLPSQLCCLLYAVVPKRHHLPVRFHNRRRKDLYGDRGYYLLGTLPLKGGVEPAHMIRVGRNALCALWRRVLVIEDLGASVPERQIVSATGS
jgi:hypothetical protein